MSQRKQLEKVLLSTPGDDILETLEHFQWTQAHLAELMEIDITVLEDIIAARRCIDAPMAQKLEAAFGVAAGFWLSRESGYRERLAALEKVQK